MYEYSVLCIYLCIWLCVGAGMQVYQCVWIYLGVCVGLFLYEVFVECLCICFLCIYVYMSIQFWFQVCFFISVYVYIGIGMCKYMCLCIWMGLLVQLCLFNRVSQGCRYVCLVCVYVCKYVGVCDFEFLFLQKDVILKASV